ncbi:protein tyrosine phosphatase (plasmid) [Aestuarium zhoushanense]|nr:protein tyrosine phosphatase [Aestuarium zhoushanense]
MLSLGGLAFYLWGIQASGNFATVVEGEVYRSNQVTAERLAQYRDIHGIRTVLNLRGSSPGSPWYDEEVRAAAALGIQLIDFGLSAQTELTEQQVNKLTAILRDAPKPLLIHCRSGADRTGLASLIYQAVIAGIAEDRAERQLSLRFGHFSIPVLSQAWSMDQTWERIEASSALD